MWEKQKKQQYAQVDGNGGIEAHIREEPVRGKPLVFPLSLRKIQRQATPVEKTVTKCEEQLEPDCRQGHVTSQVIL